ncbi:MAG: DUF1294 domain-containing protein [Oscillospiraceae bacterium]|nr:DUF1294 domain-containing protein [Oscillospiraceae bacterium]
MTIAYLFLILINAAAFVLMLVDKQKARKNKWRISESTLFTVAAAGGSLGILLGMYTFRHKTKHIRFTAGIPAILAVQIILAVILFRIL